MREIKREKEDKNESKMDKNNVSIIINGNKAEKEQKQQHLKTIHTCFVL